MAMEVPMVATDIGGLAEALVPGETGELVQPGDAEDLARVLKVFLADRERLKEMGKKAREQVRQRFSREGMTRATESVFAQLVTTPAPSR
jgi:glycosyltransferase involved in cell wall biosynthesis